MAHGFSQAQPAHIEQMINTGLNRLNEHQVAQVESLRAQLTTAGETFARPSSEHNLMQSRYAQY